MAVNRPSVEGPGFAQLVQKANALVDRLEANQWNFDSAPEVFAKTAAADVLAKEMVHIFDGIRLTRIGRLVMGGVGSHFNLMGPIPAHSEFKVTDSSVMDEINQQLGTQGLNEFPEFRNLGLPQRVEFYNYGLFYELKDLVRWLVLHDTGCFPSTLEHMVRHFASGSVVQNSMYRPANPSMDAGTPAVMLAACLSVSFNTRVMEWMDKQLFGGLNPNTIHIEYLLTPDRSTVSHPYLPPDIETVVNIGGRSYHLRRFKGISTKDAVRGPGVPPEGQKLGS
jgi:hypothetical protein